MLTRFCAAATYTIASYLPTILLDALLNLPAFLIGLRNKYLPISPRVVQRRRQSASLDTSFEKKKEDESKEKARERGADSPLDARRGGDSGLTQPGGEKVADSSASSAGGAETAERGRTIDKGKARVQVVGFDGANQDGTDENECVPIVIAP